MNYLIIGAGGAGGCLAAFMTEGGLDVDVVDKGEHLEAMKKNGLTVHTDFRGTFTVPVRAYSPEDYNGVPGVIILCVKQYSLEETIPFIRRAARPGTIVIPICNMFDIGLILQKKLPEMNVMDGCGYISASVIAPGEIQMYGRMLSLVYGVREQEMYTRLLDLIAYELRKCGIEGTVSDTIMAESMKKFSFVSAIAACMYNYHCKAKDMQKKGEERDLFIKLVQEIEQMSEAMDIKLKGDIIQTNLGLLDNLDPESTSSLIRDIDNGVPTEIDGLIFEVIRRSSAIGIELPEYTKIALKAGYKE